MPEVPISERLPDFEEGAPSTGAMRAADYISRHKLTVEEMARIIDVETGGGAVASFSEDMARTARRAGL